MDRDRFEAALDKYVDPATGKRRVTSLSKLPVPEEGLSGNMEDQRVAGIFKARMCGSDSCRVSSVAHARPAAAVRSHGTTASRTSAWSSAPHMWWTPHGRSCAAGPFLLRRECLPKVEASACLRMRDSSLRVLARSACGAVRSYDGSEDCLLVQTAKFVFAWELLLHDSAMVTSNMKVTLYGFWCARHYLEPA